jgi:hypothetical protein
MDTALDHIAQRVVEGSLKIPVKTFRLDQIVDADISIERSTAAAKIVVLM